MREVYPICLIDADNSRASREVIKSLGYSTHCKYFIKGNNDLKITDFPHFHELSSLNVVSDGNTFNVDCLDNNFIFYHNQIDSLVYNRKLEELKELLDNLNFSLKNFLTNDNYWVGGEIVFLIDFEGECIPLSAFLDGGTRKYFASNELKVALADYCQIISNKNFRDIIFTVNIKNVRSNFEFANYISKFRSSWVLFRSLGINIPLIAIQNLFLRKIATNLFMSPEFITMTDDGQLFYSYNPKKYYFDLDETLICRGYPIQKTVKFLFSLKRQGKDLFLLTRHIYNIESTLVSIGVDPNIFNEIIKVEPDQNKSAYIERNSDAFFIDNEFPERFDVWKNCEINVLDLDQIDFIKYLP